VWLKANIPDIPKGPLKTFSVAMDDIYKVPGDPVHSYIRYYKGSKQARNLTTYTRREKPWFLYTIKKGV
jgi:hypothetical protein